jgi:hypothetical protein
MWAEILTFRNVHYSVIMIQLMRLDLRFIPIENHQSPADSTNSIPFENIEPAFLASTSIPIVHSAI